MGHSTSSGRSSGGVTQARSEPVGQSNIQQEFENRRNVRDEGYNRFDTPAAREAAQKEIAAMKSGPIARAQFRGTDGEYYDVLIKRDFRLGGGMVYAMQVYRGEGGIRSGERIHNQEYSSFGAAKDNAFSVTGIPKPERRRTRR